MKPNVFITARKLGKRVYRFEGHNTWTSPGLDYLRDMLSYSSYSPDTPVFTGRLKYIGIGIGGVDQGATIDSTVDTAYPAGDDPHSTNGRQYDHTMPFALPITTLERPVRFSGGTNPYSSADPGDVWLSAASIDKFLVTRPSTGRLIARYFLDTSTEVVYAPFTDIPMSELGLVQSAGSTDVNTPYNEVVAYVNFSTLNLSAGIDVELTWIIDF